MTAMMAISIVGKYSRTNVRLQPPEMVVGEKRLAPRVGM